MKQIIGNESKEMERN